MRFTSRTVMAAVALAAVLTVLLAGWYVTGRADVRTRQRELTTAPMRELGATGAAIAEAMRAELARVIGREAARPYFHYQNLFHDPRAGSNQAVAPSPLASNPEDALILGYFQIDGTGKATTPTVNDEVPALSEPTRLAAHRQFREEVARALGGTLAVPSPVMVASADAAPQPRSRPHRAPPLAVANDAQAQAQVYEVDPGTYAQNAAPTQIYRQQNSIEPTAEPEPDHTSNVTPGPRPRPVRDPAPVPAIAAAAPLAITVSALEWRTLPFGGAPALVAVRHVETPDGTLAQGFVIDRSALTTWLATHAGEVVATVVASDAPGIGIVPGWQLEVAANPRAAVAATAAASTLARSFDRKLAASALLALVAAAFVVWLVARAEQLAHERSQFAAAAAHELRTPLAGLQLYGDMLAGELGDPSKQRDYARRMSEEASRLGRVVSNVLGFSQLERGNLGVDPRPGPLADALRELAASATPALERAGAILVVDVPDTLDARFDRDALARIVGNLLDNAEKYSRGAADRTVELTAVMLPTAVEVAVRDHGAGIAPATRSKLFRPFTRTTSADAPPGLGLGLALSRSLARAMSATLELAPGTGTGTTFVLRLPRAA